MARKRPCRICGKWFYPSPRAGDRQRVCSAAACQRERHRRSCSGWHEKNPDYDRERRLREKVRRPEHRGEPDGDPLREIAWDEARDAVGLQTAVIVEETARVVVQFARDVVGAQPRETRAKLDQQVDPRARDAIAGMPRPG